MEHLFNEVLHFLTYNILPVVHKSLILLLCFFTLSCGTSEGPMPPVTTPNNPQTGPEELTVSLEPLKVQEGDSGMRSAFASVRLSEPSTETVTIFVETEDGSAEADVDYLPVSRSVEFTPGLVQENIRIEILGDELSEIDETFKLKIVNVTGAVLGTDEVNITIENDDLGSGTVAIPATGYSTPEEYTGLNLIWSDEFDADRLNETFWTFEIGNGSYGWGNNELEFYRRDNTTLVDGHLVIEARDESINGFDYTSSRLKTQGKFNFTHGRVDIRAVLPEGQGIWPALWMLGESITSVGWPRCGEIDIMEILGHEPSKLHATVHYANNNGDRVMNGTSTNLPGGQKFSDEFHVFSIIWEEDRIQFLLDDVPYHNITRNTLGLSNPYPFNEPFFFIFNVAVGGNWPGSPDGTTRFPQHMIVDYIRVFQP